MQQGSQEEIRESNDQFIAISRLSVRCTATPEIAELPGLVATYASSPLAMLNNVFLDGPVADRADLERRTARAVAFAAERRVPWLYNLCRDFLPDGADEVLAGFGLRREMQLAGMVADALAPPLRPLPALDLRRIDDEATAHLAGAINCLSYDLPVELGRDTVCRLAFYDGERHGYLGYIDDEAVTTATTTPLDGRLHVALVATLPGQRRRGFAEEVTRQSLAAAARASGLSRTVLHATEVGLSMYEQMGYRGVTSFACYMMPEDGGGHA